MARGRLGAIAISPCVPNRAPHSLGIRGAVLIQSDAYIGPSGPERTIDAVRRQVGAMGSDVFELGLFKPEGNGNEAIMLPRTWDVDALLRSVAWLRHQNREGWNIYIRPKGEHNLSLVDDLTDAAVAEMKRAGFAPAAVVETSQANFQAWLKHPEKLSKEIGTAAARALACRFGGDPGAADWRHFGRLSGFTNKKPAHRDAATGLHPFVKLIEAEGATYSEAHRFLSEIQSAIERELSARLPKAGPNLAKRYAEPVWVRPPAGFTRMKSLSHLT